MPDKPISLFKLFSYDCSLRDKFIIFIGVILSLLTGANKTITEYVFALQLDQIINSRFNYDELKNLCLIQLILCITNILLSNLMTWIWNYYDVIIYYRYRTKYLQSLLNQEQGYFDNNNPYLINSKMQIELKAIQNGISLKLGIIIMFTGNVLVSIIFAFYMSWKLTLIYMCILPFTVVSIFYADKLFLEHEKNNINQSTKVRSHAEEILSKLKTFSAFYNYQHEINKLNDNLKSSMQLSKKLSLKKYFIISLLNIFINLGVCLLIIFGTVLIAYKNELNLGNLIFIHLSFSSATLSLNDYLPNIRAIYSALASAKNFFSLLERVPQIDLHNSNKNLDANCDIIFKDVCFQYNINSKIIFQNLNFIIPYKQITIILGDSGEGKSTLISLLLRLYDPNSGSIYIGNNKLIDLDLNHMRSQIGYVNQEPVLFDTTIKENIKCGRDYITDEDIQRACRLAQVNFLDKFENGLETNVGINGSLLSGGQKQRISIARAIAGNPQIYIFDEVTSAQDKENTELLLTTFKLLSENSTVILITHDVSSIEMADSVYQISKCTVSECKKSDYAINNQSKYVNDNNNYSFSNESNTNVSQESNDEKDRLLNVVETSINTQKKFNFIPILLKEKCKFILAFLVSLMSGLLFPVRGAIVAHIFYNMFINSLNEDIIKIGWQFAIYFFIFSLGFCLIIFLRLYLYDIIGEFITSEFRKNLFKKMLKMEIGYFESKNRENYLNKITHEANKIKFSITSLLSLVFVAIFGIIFSILIGIYFSWRLSLLLGLIQIIYFTLFYILNRINLTHQGNITQIENEIENFSYGMITNTKTVFCYNLQLFADSMLKLYLKQKQNILSFSFWFEGIIFSMFQSNSYIYYVFGIFYAGWLVENKFASQEIIFSAYMVLNQMIYIIFALKNMKEFEQGNLALDNINDLLNLKSKINPFKTGKYIPSDIKGKIEFCNVTFSYPSQKSIKVLKNVSFVIQPGEYVTITGPSGCGKSTIIQLLLRFYDPDEGLIFIDDISIKHYDLISLRLKIGVVFQEPELYKINIKENIRNGKLTASDNEVNQIALKTSIDPILLSQDSEDLPYSGGEKQRIAIARALIRSPEIYLLDEITSALDQSTEYNIIRILNENIKGKTVIMVAHRQNLIGTSNKIFKLENGFLIK